MTCKFGQACQSSLTGIIGITCALFEVVRVVLPRCLLLDGLLNCFIVLEQRIIVLLHIVLNLPAG